MSSRRQQQPWVRPAPTAYLVPLYLGASGSSPFSPAPDNGVSAPEQPAAQSHSQGRACGEQGNTIWQRPSPPKPPPSSCIQSFIHPRNNNCASALYPTLGSVLERETHQTDSALRRPRGSSPRQENGGSNRASPKKCQKDSEMGPDGPHPARSGHWMSAGQSHSPVHQSTLSCRTLLSLRLHKWN